MDQLDKPIDEAQARAAVKAALEAVKADDVRVDIRAGRTGFLRYAVNEATTAGVVTDATASITCAVGARHATVSVHGLRPADVAAAARRALELAKLAPEDPEWLPSPPPATMKPVPAAWCPRPVTPADRAALVADSIAEAKKQKLVAAGFLQHVSATTVVATRAGFFGRHDETSLDLSTTLRTPDGSGSGWAMASSVDPSKVDAVAATRVAADKAHRSKGARPLDPGTYPVVLEPAAVAGLLAFLQDGALEARAADEGRSPFTKPGGGTRLGEKLFGTLTLRSDPWSPLVPTAPFDGQGMPRTPATWVKDGVLGKLRVSRYWGKKTKRPADAAYDTLSASGPKAEPLDSLVAGLERGLVVTRFWYIRMLEPQTLTLTGLTRDGVFLVEKGKIVAPVNNFRFNQSVTRMFADADGYGEPVRVSTEDGDLFGAPAVRCKAFHMASRSDAV